MTSDKKLPELLAPAGSPEALDAAIEAGADAVYFGAGDFNARMRAKNFTDSELSSSLRRCAERGVKTYITVNTRLKDSELSAVVSLAERLYLDGAGALIIADPGAVSEIRRRIPKLELHASTQMSGHSVADAEALCRLGMARMVCPREMSLPEIEYLSKNSPIEIEMFIHGAHCVSFSGQCLMSFALGGRSGNRGMCAQPCRLPYSVEGVENKYPLSLKDMCLAADMTGILKSGVASLKIEGRQKSADYVYGVVSVYRRLLDGRRDATEDEIEELSRLFNRDGFTNGYLKGVYRSMLGVRGEDEKTSPSLRTGELSKISLDAALRVKVGEPSSLTYTDGERRGTAYGAVVAARESGEPMDPDAAREKASKLGGTQFALGSFECEIDHAASFSLSELNRLRREAIERLVFPEPRSTEDFADLSCGKTEKKAFSRKIMTAEFPSYEAIPPEAFEYFEKIYIPLSEIGRADGQKICVALDPTTYDGAKEHVISSLRGYTGEVLVHGVGQALTVREAGAHPVGSFRLNVTNSKSAEALLGFVDALTVSVESPSALCRDVPGVTSVVVYGRLPLMHTERCLISDGGERCSFGGCGGRTNEPRGKTAKTLRGKTCDGTLCRAVMTDRTGAEFPVFGLSDCSNVIFNSVPVYMADKKEFFDACAADRFHFIFTTETPDECRKVINAYKRGAVPDGAVRRIK